MSKLGNRLPGYVYIPALKYLQDVGADRAEPSPIWLQTGCSLMGILSELQLEQTAQEFSEISAKIVKLGKLARKMAR